MAGKLVSTYKEKNPDEEPLMKAMIAAIHNYEKFKGKKLKAIQMHRSKNPPKEGVPIFTKWEFEFEDKKEGVK